MLITDTGEDNTDPFQNHLFIVSLTKMSIVYFLKFYKEYIKRGNNAYKKVHTHNSQERKCIVH